MQILDNIRIVLVEPSHPGNVGAVARSMKTMGLSRLVLINPKKFPHAEATNRAVGADSVLIEAQVHDSLVSGIGDCNRIYGTSVRDREVAWPTVDPRQAAEQLIEHIMLAPSPEAEVSGQQVAILFGRESSGLTNQELELCDAQIRINANSEYTSLNLASAVQIISYELRMVALRLSSLQTETPAAEVTAAVARQASASLEQREGHLEHLLETLNQLDFIKSKPPTQLMRKLTRLYNKADLSVEEIQILRGFLSAIQNQLGGSNLDDD